MSANLIAVEDRAQALAARHGERQGAELLRPMIEAEFSGSIALVSSFGSEAAVLLHMVAGIDPATPVIFLDSGKLFGETLRYRDRLVRDLGIEDIRSIEPDPAEVGAHDPRGDLWATNSDLCCFYRKVEPLRRALQGFDAWITGRKGYHGGERAGLSPIEAVDGRVKLNPLAGWRKSDIDFYFEAHDLPPHPLEADGFLSIGCLPCTERVAPGEDLRSGRWKGSPKSECGIHLTANLLGPSTGANP